MMSTKQGENDMTIKAKKTLLHAWQYLRRQEVSIFMRNELWRNNEAVNLQQARALLSWIIRSN